MSNDLAKRLCVKCQIESQTAQKEAKIVIETVISTSEDWLEQKPKQVAALQQSMPLRELPCVLIFLRMN